jgi:hypothetical protein
MPPVWTDLATAAALVNDGDLVALVIACHEAVLA